jgi:structural maintenance of chromosome 2
MVEEAAGTRMFEERKDKAARTMAKKEKKVSEISSLLAEEISPKLEKLRTEKRAYLAYQKTCAELERIGRVLRAWEWTDHNARVVKKQEDLARIEHEVSALRKNKKEWAREVEKAESQVDELVKKRDKELKKGGRYAKLEVQVSELEKEVVKVRTQVEIKGSNITDEQDRVKKSEEELAEVSSTHYFCTLFSCM